MAIAQRGLTLEQFLKLPEEKPALEYFEGVVSQKVSPKGKHGRLQAELANRLGQVAHATGSVVVFTELRVTFEGVSRVPDLAVYRRDRVPLDETGEIANDFLLPPDIAIEIVSPEQSVNSLVRRCLWYVDHGVSVALLVDPKDASVLIFRADQLPAVRRGNERIDLGEILPGFELTAEGLFASLRP